MTYYEEAIVKKYKRKNNKDSTQINLGVNSKFKKNTKVAIITKNSFDEINKGIDDFKKGFLNELKENSQIIVDENEFNKLSDEHSNLKEENEKLKEENSRLTNEIIQLHNQHNAELTDIADKVNFKKELDDIKNKFEETTSSNAEFENLKKQLMDEKEDKEKLLIKVAIQSENLNLLTEKENIIKTYEKDIKNKKEIIETLTKNWVWYKRIFNILPSELILNNGDEE